MSPIEEFLVTRLARELESRGVPDAAVAVLAGAADDWGFRVAVEGRVFETGFNHRRRFWCHETTPGGSRDLVSNDATPICTSPAARRMAVRLIATAIHAPNRLVHNPPVI